MPILTSEATVIAVGARNPGDAKTEGSFGKNITANLFGKIWSAALMFIFPPIYVKLLGIEAYGIIGLYASMVAILAILDLGLSTTLNREMARLSGQSGAAAHMRDTLRTFELIFWALGILAAAVIYLLAPFIGAHWVHAQQMSVDSVARAVKLCGLVFALQWPLGLYNGALAGLQRQVEANVVLVIFVGIRVAGAAGALVLIHPTVEVFFLWQAAAFALQTVVTRGLLARLLPHANVGARFRADVLRANLTFSAGVSVIGILAMFLTQADKLIVSKLAPLSVFGYYALAWNVGTALYALIGPVFVAVFPPMSQLAKLGDDVALARLYHLAAQIMSVLVLPAAVVVTFFSKELVYAWTGDPAIAEQTRAVVAIVTVGTALNGLMNIPYALQLAYGWTRLAIWTNVVGLLVVVPMEYVLTRTWGVVGAAIGWAVLNLGYVLINAQLMHRRLLRAELRRWYMRDIAEPLFAAVVAVLPGWWLVGQISGRVRTGIYIGVAEAGALGVACLVAREVRPLIISAIRRLAGATT